MDVEHKKNNSPGTSKYICKVPNYSNLVQQFIVLIQYTPTNKNTSDIPIMNNNE